MTYTHAYINQVTADLQAVPATRANVEAVLGRIQRGLSEGTYLP